MNASIAARSQWNNDLPLEIKSLTWNADRHAGHE
jgi:hypothetical protein